jgi:Fe-S-cluster containining protein
MRYRRARMAKPKKPIRPRVEPELGPEAGPTFGEEIERLGMLEKTSAATRGIIEGFNRAADEYTRVRLTVVTCYACDAPKACCSEPTSAYLYEAVPIAARLRRDGRDTPELRAQLKAYAHAMETTRRGEYARPCLFLGEAERCTIYEDRPSVCGTHLVESPPIHCSDRSPTSMVGRINGPGKEDFQPEYEELFTQALGLRRIGRLYVAAMPRMVLLCLEAWDRRDYVSYLAERVMPAAARLSAAIR